MTTATKRQAAAMRSIEREQQFSSFLDDLAAEAPAQRWLRSVGPIARAAVEESRSDPK